MGGIGREFLADLNSWDIYASALVTAPSGDPQYFFTTSCLPGMSYNFCAYENGHVNELIEKMMSDGRFEEICDRYFGDGTPVAVKSASLDSSKDQLVVATNAAFEPFEYKKGDSYYGIDMEIADVIAKELGLELVIADMDFDAVCLSVGQHKADIAMAGLTVREDRKEYVEFSTSYYNASQKLIVKSGDDTFKDCKTASEIEEKLKEKFSL